MINLPPSLLSASVLHYHQKPPKSVRLKIFSFPFLKFNALWGFSL